MHIAFTLMLPPTAQTTTMAAVRTADSKQQWEIIKKNFCIDGDFSRVSIAECYLRVYFIRGIYLFEF